MQVILLAQPHDLFTMTWVFYGCFCLGTGKNLEVSNIGQGLKKNCSFTETPQAEPVQGLTLQGEVDLTVLISDRLRCARAAQQPRLSRLTAETESKQECNPLTLQLAGDPPSTLSSAKECTEYSGSRQRL